MAKEISQIRAYLHPDDKKIVEPKAVESQESVVLNSKGTKNQKKSRAKSKPQKLEEINSSRPSIVVRERSVSPLKNVTFNEVLEET